MTQVGKVDILDPEIERANRAAENAMDRTRRFRFLDPGRVWCDLCVRWSRMREDGDHRAARLFEVLVMLQEIYPNEVLTERERRGIAPIDHLRRGGHLNLVASKGEPTLS